MEKAGDKENTQIKKIKISRAQKWATKLQPILPQNHSILTLFTGIHHSFSKYVYVYIHFMHWFDIVDCAVELVN